MFWWKDKQIAEDIKAPEGAEVIEGNGKTLMPGLIDCHQHLNQGGLSLADQFANLYYIGIAQGKYATGTLMRGLPSVRDPGGDSMGRSFCGRLYPLPVQQQTSAHASANGKYLGDTGRSWGKRLALYFRTIVPLPRIGHDCNRRISLGGNMSDLLAGMTLVIAAFGIVAAAGGLLWCWMMVAPRIRRLYY